MEFNQLVEDYYKLLEEYKNELKNHPFLKIPQEAQPLINKHLEKLEKKYCQIQEASEAQKKYFDGASFEIFAKHIAEKEAETELNDPHFSIYSFYKSLYRSVFKYSIEFPDYFEPLPDELKIQLKRNFHKRVEYLELKLYEMGIEVIKTRLTEFSKPEISFKENMERKFSFENKLHQENKEEHRNILDLSESKGTEKIIYLQELGILDYLRSREPFNISTRAMATAISAITGENATTIQSYLNPIVNPQTRQHNNPLKSHKKVENIKHTLINLGFKP